MRENNCSRFRGECLDTHLYGTEHAPEVFVVSFNEIPALYRPYINSDSMNDRLTSKTSHSSKPSKSSSDASFFCRIFLIISSSS